MGFIQTINERFSDWNYGHPIMLYGFIRALKPLVVVESGSYRGFGACWMAKAIQENNFGKLYCIDNFTLTEHVERYGDPRTHLEENLKACGIREWVEIIEGNANEVKWPEKIDICYIDGWHSYEAASFDFGKADQAGATIIAFDDTENCVGPRMFCEEAREKFSSKFDVMDVHSDNGMTIFMRKKPKRPITFSQELPLPNPGVDLRPLTLVEQEQHFKEAAAITGLNYSKVMKETEHV